MNHQASSAANELRELQLVELELIRIFVNICEKEHLTYYMLGGTMLGAVRHQGFIPWDDDADFGMPRGDYETFLKVSTKYLGDEARLSTFDGADQYKYFAQLLSEKKRIRIEGVQRNHESNLWIDIFPLDGMPENSIVRYLHRIRLLILRKSFLLAYFDKDVPLHYARRSWYNRVGVYICSHIPVQRLFSGSLVKRRLDRALKAYPYEKSSWNLNLMGAWKFRELFRQSVFGEGALYDFEGMKLRGPKDYDAYLAQLYGDYMTPPPESERCAKHYMALVED